MKIKICCEGVATLPIDKIEPFQGNLKELSVTEYEKLKKSIIDYGFSFPIFIWRNTGKFFTIDGHQRLNTIRLMVADGYECPDLPVVWIHAADEKEAKTKILLAIGSYGKVTNESLYEFVEKSQLDLELLKKTVTLPSLDWRYFDEINGDISEVEEISEATNFIIKCQNLAELRELKQKLNCESVKMDYAVFCKKVGL